MPVWLATLLLQGGIGGTQDESEQISLNLVLEQEKIHRLIEALVSEGSRTAAAGGVTG